MIRSKKLGYALIGFSLILLVVLFFTKVNIDRQAAFLCQVTEADPNLDMEECPAHQNDVSWLLTSAFGLGFLMLGVGIYASFAPMQIQRKKRKYKDIDESKLNEDERKVYELLKENKGSMYQGDIVKQTEFSKVKVSRILDRLSTKDIAERKRRGMTNLVVLK